MPNIDNTGFRPAVPNPDKVRRFPVTTSNPTNLFIGDAVKAESNGGVTPLDAGATGNDLALGVIVGLYDATGIPVSAPGSTVTTKYLGSSTAGYADVHLALPGEQFIGQSQTGTSYAATDIFAGVNIVAGVGSTTTARSGHELGATGGTDCLLLQIVNDPLNSYGVNVDVYFCFLSSYFGQINPTGGV